MKNKKSDFCTKQISLNNEEFGLELAKVTKNAISFLLCIDNGTIKTTQKE